MPPRWGEVSLRIFYKTNFIVYCTIKWGLYATIPLVVSLIKRLIPANGKIWTVRRVSKRIVLCWETFCVDVRAGTPVLALVLLLPEKIMMVAILYLVLSGAYLVVIPFALYAYLQQRWYVASSFERSFMYFLVFFFFPGLLLLSPFLNFRPKRRQVQS